MNQKTPCECQHCGRGCRPQKPKKTVAQALTARPWIWVVLGYLTFIGGLGAMVAVAVRHRQPDVLVQKK